MFDIYKKKNPSKKYTNTNKNEMNEKNYKNLNIIFQAWDCVLLFSFFSLVYCFVFIIVIYHLSEIFEPFCAMIQLIFFAHVLNFPSGQSEIVFYSLQGVGRTIKTRAH